MKLAETVTFGGSGLDRAAELRGDSVGLDALMSDIIVFWRTKPLVVDTGAGMALCRIDASHALVVAFGPPQLFLGRDGGRAIWALDISEWEPKDLDEDALGGFLDDTEQRHPNAPAGSYFAELRAVMTQLSPRECEVAASARGLFAWHASHGFCARCGEASEMTMSGWQRNCAACGRHHFPRTDPVAIMLITHGNDVLIGRSPGWPEGMYSLLAGFVEPGETLEAAVRREVFEEAGVRVGEVSYLASQPWPFPASLMFGCRGQATSRAINVDPNEIEDAMWVSRERMAEIFAGRDNVVKPARKGAIAHFLLWHWLADRLD